MIRVKHAEKIRIPIILEHDFGRISPSDENVECRFTFTNLGDKPVVITKVSASCGCTASEWTKEPVGLKKQGLVKVAF